MGICRPDAAPDLPARLAAFVQADLCDVYLECAKLYLYWPPATGAGAATESALQQRRETLVTLHQSLDAVLRAMHPVCPHVTEELWHVLRHH